jgi:cytochrome d ubiquinol oxidase subunit I
MDLVALSRLQFALTIMFHYLFPPLTIGLGLLMVIAEGLGLYRKDREYIALAKFWSKLFAVTFAVGVASGIVMEFQFGTNWSAYSRYVGDVFGSALAAEGIFAFFLESGFLAVVVFGWNRVSPRLHYFATCMVFFGSMFSAVWIVVANSWMQTPAGFHIVGEGALARAEITDFWAMVLNPSAPHRLNHVLLGSFAQGAFFVLSISAFYILRGRHVRVAQKGFVIALFVAALSSFALLVSGHAQAKMVAEHQPAKLAAFEGHFRTLEGGAPLCAFGIPDEEAQELKYGVCVPGLLSFLVHEDFSKSIPALDAFPPEDRPPVMIPFQAYHLMVALGSAFIGLSLLGLALWYRKKLWDTRWLLWVFVGSVVGPVIANQAGWVAAEVGRQPWIVYGLLRTKDGVSPTVPAEHVLASIILFAIVYVGLFGVWLFVLNSKIQHGPELGDTPSPHSGLGATDSAEGVLEAAGLRQAHAVGYSLTLPGDASGSADEDAAPPTPARKDEEN